MAKPSWLTLSKTSGSGDSSFTVSAAQHTGRQNRSGTVTVKATGVTNSKSFTVSQTAKALFASFNDGSSKSIAAAGGNITISGKTNAKSLEFYLLGATAPSDGTLEKSVKCYFKVSNGKGGYVNVETYNSEASQTITLPTNYTANGGQLQNGANVTNDPGVDNEFTFSIVIAFAANNANLAQNITLGVKAVGDNSASTTASIELVQAKGSAFFGIFKDSAYSQNLENGTITLVNAGTAQTIYVDSNTDWTVE